MTMVIGETHFIDDANETTVKPSEGSVLFKPVNGIVSHEWTLPLDKADELIDALRHAIATGKQTDFQVGDSAYHIRKNNVVYGVQVVNAEFGTEVEYSETGAALLIDALEGALAVASVA